jgi:hypothetical protein
VLSLVVLLWDVLHFQQMPALRLVLLLLLLQAWS